MAWKHDGRRSGAATRAAFRFIEYHMNMGRTREEFVALCADMWDFEVRWRAPRADDKSDTVSVATARDEIGGE